MRCWSIAVLAVCGTSCGLGADPVAVEIETYAAITCDCFEELGHASEDACEDSVLADLRSAERACLGGAFGLDSVGDPVDPDGPVDTPGPGFRYGNNSCQLSAWRALNRCVATPACSEEALREACRDRMTRELGSCTGTPVECFR